MAFITAQTGKNVKALVNLAQSLFKQSRNRVSTGTLNRILREAVDAHPPSSRENRTPRIYYATQVGVTPPTVVLFVNSTKLFDPTYQRYLLNVFRERLPFRDIPIKLYMRSRRQAEEGSRSSTEKWEDPSDAIEPDVRGRHRCRFRCTLIVGPSRRRQPLLEPRSERVAFRARQLKIGIGRGLPRSSACDESELRCSRAAPHAGPVALP